MPNARVPFFRNSRRLRLRSCLRFPPFYFIFTLDHTPSRERGGAARAHRGARRRQIWGRREKRKERHERCAWGRLLRSAVLVLSLPAPVVAVARAAVPALVLLAPVLAQLSLSGPFPFRSPALPTAKPTVPLAVASTAVRLRLCAAVPGASRTPAAGARNWLFELLCVLLSSAAGDAQRSLAPASLRSTRPRRTTHHTNWSKGHAVDQSAHTSHPCLERWWVLSLHK
jgi:hypothetical protein